MQYEFVFKVIGGVHVILAFLVLLLLLLKVLGKMAAPGTDTGAPQMDQRLLTNTWPKQCTTISIQANTKKTKKQYINT